MNKERPIKLSWFLGALLLLAGCRSTVATLPGFQERPEPLRQPLTLEKLYWATPAVERHQLQAPLAEDARQPDAATLINQGATLYVANCAPCHQINGEGRLGRFPALNRNAFVTNDVPQPLIRTVLYGRGQMPAYTATLTDLEVAAILSYIRSSWNNNAPVVNPEEVQTVAPMPLPTATTGNR